MKLITTTNVLVAIVIILIIIGIIFIVVKNKKINNLKKYVFELEKEKNLIVNAPVLTELSKVQNLVKNERLTYRYNKWNSDILNLKDVVIPKITDLILEIDAHVENKEYNIAIKKITYIEIEIQKSKKKADYLLKEMEHITSSESRNRDYITKLKSQYRTIMNKFNKNKEDYDEIAHSIELQSENVENKFKEFEDLLENNEYEEVERLIDSLDKIIKNLSVIVEEVPSIVLMGKGIIPKKILDLSQVYAVLKDDGFNLDYLNVEYNINEIKEKVKAIFDRAKILNIEDSILELKTIIEYFDTVMNSFEMEKRDEANYRENCKHIYNKLKKLRKVLKDLCVNIEDYKISYDLSEEEVNTLYSINDELSLVKEDYEKLIMEHTRKTFAFSRLCKESEILSIRVTNLENKLDYCLDTLGNLKEDESRAKEQLTEIKVLLKQAKSLVKEYKLPVIPNKFYVELDEATTAIREVVKELEKQPITISTLNVRVDTARDLVLKVFNSANEMIKTAKMTEFAIVYGNRYRSTYEEVNKGLDDAENLFYKGDYKKALECTINSIELIETGIYDKLLTAFK